MVVNVGTTIKRGLSPFSTPSSAVVDSVIAALANAIFELVGPEASMLGVAIEAICAEAGFVTTKVITTSAAGVICWLLATVRVNFLLPSSQAAVNFALSVVPPVGRVISPALALAPASPVIVTIEVAPSSTFALSVTVIVLLALFTGVLWAIFLVVNVGTIT